MGCYGGASLSWGVFHLKEVVDLAIQYVGEGKFVEMLKADGSESVRKLGEDWERTKRKLRNFDFLLNRCKGYYEKIEKKDFGKINSTDCEEFIEYAESVSLIKPYIFSLFMFILKTSALQRQSIPSDAWKIAEYSSLKKLDVSRRRPQLIQESTPTTDVRDSGSEQ